MAASVKSIYDAHKRDWRNGQKNGGFKKFEDFARGGRLDVDRKANIVRSAFG